MMAIIHKRRGTIKCIALLGIVGLLGSYNCAAAEAVRTRGSPAVSNSECEVLHWDRTHYAHVYLPIRSSGKYCIDQDYRPSCSEWMGSCGSSAFLDIKANDVEIDLRGHTLSRSGRALEVFGQGKNISIKNGVIKNGSIHIRTPEVPSYYVINGTPPWVDPDFEVNSFTRIENVRIVDGNIEVAGANVVVRNNEVSLGAGYLAPISIYGPYPIIEDNRLTRATEPSKFPSFGIYLRAGNGAVVRGNTIENNGTRENATAIGLRDSKGVRVENNGAENFDKFIERIGMSDEKEKGNTAR